MPPATTRINVKLTDAQKAALDAYCESAGVDKSDLIRRLICQAVGRQDLDDSMPGRGRPKAPPAPAPKKKAARKR